MTTSTTTAFDSDWTSAVVAELYARVLEHTSRQFTRQSGCCAGCGRVLPTIADGLLRLDGTIECIDCHLKGRQVTA